MIKMHSIQKGSYFLNFLEIHHKLASKTAFENNIISYVGHSWDVFVFEERKTERKTAMNISVHPVYIMFEQGNGILNALTLSLHLPICFMCTKVSQITLLKAPYTPMTLIKSHVLTIRLY